MAPKRKLGPSSEGAGPSRPAKSRGLTSSFQENTTDPFLLEMHHMIRTLNCKIEELQAEIRAQNCKIEELHAKICAQNCKIEALQAEVVGINEQSPSILGNPIDENLTTREPANHGQCELKIMNNIKKRIYTGSEVQGQDGEILKVAICYNGQKITTEPLASARFEVVVLERNSNKFEESLVTGRPEVGSVLANEYISQFSNGEAVLQGLKFKDNSNWAPGKKWWLGIRILGKFDVKIKEAISGPFRVLDRHGKASEKPDIPLLDHGVGRLEKVGKERASDLEKNGINTVKDLLQLHHMNPTKLLEILKMPESDKQWKTMITHAKKCDAGSNLYSYKRENTVLFFNSVYELMGADFGNGYLLSDKLQDSEKELVNKWKKGFYEKIKNKSFPADFKLLNGQPVRIECNFTDQAALLQNSQSADITHFPDGTEQQIRRNADQTVTAVDNSTQYFIPDQVALLQHRQSVDITHSHDAAEPDIGRDSDQNITTDHNTTRYYNRISDLELPHAFQESPIHSVTFSPMWTPADEYPNMIMGLSHTFQDIPIINSLTFSPSWDPADFLEDTPNGEQVGVPFVRGNFKAKWSISILAIRASIKLVTRQKKKEKQKHS
ncbi:hypothetical protein LUZ62_064560 [Rhynchospora pubera]|uniref:Uncharacterized protein n=1 Tax=Rhynchospora pubera TaxID=906938 RepID=A0AAV8EPU4_9POAL|nr:hypothetical protein LUZ62_064560 [Rhynchospora pubera]